MGPENGLERRVWQFYTICDKKSASKSKKIDKVTAILVPRSGGASSSLHGALRKSLYGSVWWTIKNRAVTFYPHPPTLSSARIL
jgi:hypothetical protein